MNNKLIKMDVPQTVQMEIQKCPICGEVPVIKTATLDTFSGHTSIHKQVAVCNSCGLTAPLDKWNGLHMDKKDSQVEKTATVCKYCQIPVDKNRFGTNFGADILGERDEYSSVRIGWDPEQNNVTILVYLDENDDTKEVFRISYCPKCGRNLMEEG